MRSTIKKLVRDRGFGLSRAADGQEVLFPRSGLYPIDDFDRLGDGDSVEFEVERSEKGPRAINVRPTLK